MRRAIVIGVACAVVGLPTSAGAATVETMVVGKERVLRGPQDVRLKLRTVKVGGRRCRVGAATPLSVLAATRLRLRIRDYARCGRRWRNAVGLYVFQVGRERERGTGGWVYKVGRKTGTTAAADPSGPFGTGRRLRDGQRVLWFYCRRAGDCQRSLEVRPERSTAAPGEPLRVTVRGYDDFGRGIAVEGATVRLGAATAVTGSDGVATITVPAASGTVELEAERDGMVPAFPAEVSVG